MNDVSTELINQLGLWRWLMAFIVISLMPVANSFFREWMRSRREKTTNKILEEIKKILQDQYTDDISLQMCEAILHPICDNSARFLITKGKDILKNNNLDNREAVEMTVVKTIDNMWSQNSAWMSHFFFKGHRLTEFVNDTWKVEITQLMIQSIYNITMFPQDRGVKHLENNLYTEFENIRFNTLAKLQTI